LETTWAGYQRSQRRAYTIPPRFVCQCVIAFLDERREHARSSD
jgi:hypothetical protein